jgi:hypothetical protein
MLNDELKEKITAFAKALIDQEKARIVIEPIKRESGFWFGGGNISMDKDGALYIVGRYRNFGDSRTGLGEGERGFKLVVFRSEDKGDSFSEVLSFSKADLDVGDKKVISIEGSALHFTSEGVELYVSTEKKNIAYPPDLEEFLKPGTGVWTIEQLESSSLEELKSAAVETIIQSDDPRYLHVKDPLVYEQINGDLVLLFCTHPFNWTCSNSAYAIRPKGVQSFGQPEFDFFQRGFTWDVAMSRITSLLRLPAIGVLADMEPLVLFFYDGGECVRNHDEHLQAVSRPRGYSCEELGGLAVSFERKLEENERLSLRFPMFISPYGTGCSRYIDTLSTEQGYYAIWQQSQVDLSQPLVMNFLSMEEAEQILGA